MVLASLQGIYKSYGEKVVLDGVDWQITDGKRIGLVGPNGAGKTTLLEIIAGYREPDRGIVHRRKGLRIGYMQQEAQLAGELLLKEEMERVFAPLLEKERRMRDLEEKISLKEGNLDSLLREYSRLRQEFEAEDGYLCRIKIERILYGLGFKAENLPQKVGSLSGGQKNIAALARVLLVDPQLLLLDEPTNHLDIRATEWLERFLADYSRTYIIISHDRRLLDRTTEEIVEVGEGRLKRYVGNYSAYQVQKRKDLEISQKRYELQQEWIKRTEDFIQRNIAGQKTKQAQSRRKLLQRVEMLEKPSIQARGPILRFESGEKGAQEVLSLENISKGFPGSRLFSGVSFTLLRGDRVGLVGPNGSGKTTLMKIIVGEEGADGGTVRVGKGMEIGYYSQEHEDLNREETVIDEVWEVKPHLTQGEIRSYLARFLFRGDEVFKSISALSGGEQSRVCLAKLILAQPDLLLLDEPTNHLDIPSLEVLEKALLGFKGTVFVASHDRYFLDRLVKRVFYLKGERLTQWEGNYTETEDKWRGEEKGKTATRHRRKKRRSKSPERIEKEIATLEERLWETSLLLVDREVYSDWQRLHLLLEERETLSKRIDSLYEKWEEAIKEEEETV